MPRRVVRAMCAWCGKRPISRFGGKYCGRACSGYARQGTPPHIDAAIAKNREVTFKRILALIIDDCRPHLNANREMPLEAVVKVVLKHRRKSYDRGWGAHYASTRRSPKPERSIRDESAHRTTRPETGTVAVGRPVPLRMRRGAAGGGEVRETGLCESAPPVPSQPAEAGIEPGDVVPRQAGAGGARAR